MRTACGHLGKAKPRCPFAEQLFLPLVDPLPSRAESCNQALLLWTCCLVHSDIHEGSEVGLEVTHAHVTGVTSFIARNVLTRTPQGPRLLLLFHAPHG